jgi:WD repeat-containing protein 45
VVTGALTCPQTCLHSLVPIPRYFTSEWSFAQFKVNEECNTIVGFGPQPHTLVVVTSTGSYYKVGFDPSKGGQCLQQSYCKFLDLDGDE